MNRKRQARTLRITRRIHRWMGATLFLLFLLVSLSGLLLGWKKNAADLIMPPTQKGSTHSTNGWIPLDSLASIAIQQMGAINNEEWTIDRMDVRPEKGIVKIIFQQGHWETQLDGSSGKVLSVGKRHSDWIEHLHDGSLFDLWLDTHFIKLLFTSVSGIALLTFTITGFWLWYGPKVMRKYKH
jgi:uncharacterized iron-regulated membrane protein